MAVVAALAIGLGATIVVGVKRALPSESATTAAPPPPVALPPTPSPAVAVAPAPVPAPTPPPPKPAEPAAEKVQTGVMDEVVEGDYLYCAFTPQGGKQNLLWPVGVSVDACRRAIGKTVTIRFKTERVFIPEEGVDDDRDQLLAIEGIGTELALTAPSRPEWKISEDAVFPGGVLSVQVGDFLALLASPADATGVPVTEGELRAILRDPRVAPVDVDALLKKATPPSPSPVKTAAKPKTSYVDIFLKPAKIQAAREFSSKNELALKAATSAHGVSSNDIVAVLLWQSNLGQVTGDVPLFSRYMGEWLFLHEAYRSAIAAGHADTPDGKHKTVVDRAAANALKLAAGLIRSAKLARLDVVTIKGVAGGGAGYAQFTPSGYRWLEDGDNDGVNQFDSFPDAIMSIANCLDQGGYREDRKKGLLNYNPGEEWATGIMKVADAIASSESGSTNQ